MIYFLGNSKWWRGAYYIINIWKEAGWQTVIFMATLAGINTELYEAASIDGAGRWGKMRYVTFPALQNTILTVLILNLAKVMNLFESAFVLQNDATMDVSNVLETYIYYQTFNSGAIPNYGYTTAVGLFKSLVGCVLVLISKMKSKKKIQIFPIVNGLIFILLSLIIIVPMWKVLVDSFDLKTAYGMKLWPQEFGLAGYVSVFKNPTLSHPLMISFITTIAGTLIALILSTFGAYVLIQWDMPGRNFFANMLLFTMIFQGGMIPTYLVLKSLHLTNTIWVVILFPALNVYNLVLMRNFFEGIPASLFESATLDGCSPMQTFLRIVLPMSKAALASIGLMFAVTYWNDYTHYKLYITDSNLYNFQMKLRSIIMGSDLPQANGGATENTVKNAAIIVVIIPFMILYPFLQKYFVKGVNIGAVKE